MDAVVYSAVISKGGRSAIYTNSGSFTVPLGVTNVFVSLIGGGAGGYGLRTWYDGENYSSPVAGTAGGVTSFGPYSSVSGGSPTRPHGISQTSSYQVTYEIPWNPYYAIERPFSHWGSYGSSAVGEGDYIMRFPVLVTPGQVIGITIGAGGIGGIGTSSGGVTGNYNGPSGVGGALYIEWNQ